MRSLAQQLYVTEEPDTQLLKIAAERYFSTIESGQSISCMFESIEQDSLAICKVNELTLLICFSSKIDISDEDRRHVESLRAAIVEALNKSGLYELKNQFTSIVDSYLPVELTFCFITPPAVSDEKTSEAAIHQFFSNHLGSNSLITNPVSIGPYRIRAVRKGMDDLQEMRADDLEQYDGIVFCASQTSYSIGELERGIETAKAASSVKILIVPSSDQDLEFARSIESEYDLILCDSVSPRPSDLLLSVLAMCGLTGMQPALTRKRWRIDRSIDMVRKEISPKSEEIGHQAFIVVDKSSGVADFTYFYQDDSTYLETSPNLVAAISSFNIDMANPQETSVFSVGGMKYAIVEKENRIFTLITGEDTDAVEMRTRFSVLPDIYFEDTPEKTSEDFTLYESHPFVLKLLATLPSEPLSPRFCPLRKNEPDWIQFSSNLMREFLQMVWTNVDGRKTVEELSSGDDSHMTLGALLFLKRMGSIDFGLQVSRNDTPRIKHALDSETRYMYSQLQDILPTLNGTLTIADIAQKAGIEESILMTVFSELYRRGVIDFNND